MATHAHNTGAPHGALSKPTPPAAIMTGMLNRHSEREILEAIVIMSDLLALMRDGEQSNSTSATASSFRIAEAQYRGAAERFNN